MRLFKGRYRLLFLIQAKDKFLLKKVQTGSRNYPAYCSMETDYPFQAGKAAEE
jgi:hypothetical protein